MNAANQSPEQGRLNRTLIRLENITLRVRDKFILPDTSWRIVKGQHWAILGPNGAGKSSLVRALVGDVPVVCGTISQTDDPMRKVSAEYLSFEQHQRLIAREEHRDESRFFSGRMNRITAVGDLLHEILLPEDGGSAAIDSVLASLKIKHLREKNIRTLSTGELRKVQIARVLLKSPQVMILDEPFDGLDQNSRKNLARIIDGVMDGTRTVILVTHRYREILPAITHIMEIRDNQVVFQGARDEFLRIGQLVRPYFPENRPALSIPASEGRLEPFSGETPVHLIEMKNVSVQYAGTIVLDSLNWTVKAGQNWVVLGPNGCGKTTLLNLISGDNLQGYANEIHLFGKRRGTGETIWEIKERIGIISSEFQLRYRRNVSALEVVLSGYYDSVGLYHSASAEQRQTAKQWLADLGIANLVDRTFSRLSYGEKRMVLLARAMVKIPQILILDEPYQGLDRANRQRILAAIDLIGRHPDTNIIYVTHYPDEIPACSTHMLQFEEIYERRYLTIQRRI
jgi:molybdate transport system ATP-binding protein